MIPVEEALQRFLGRFSPLAAEQIGLADGLGRVLAEDVVARRTQPPFAVSAMDGYAVRATDTQSVPQRLRVVGSAPAGKSYDEVVGAGEAVRIFTGAPLPRGADCVVLQEDADRDGDVVTVREAGRPGRHVRAEGLDFRAGDAGLRAGRVLTARDIGLAAAMNHPWLPVRRKPRVAILATGDEIVLPGAPIGANQIVSSNAPALGALVAACGGIPIQLGIAADDRRALQDMAAGAAGSDLLVTTGGASVGDHDLVRDAFAERDFELDFWKIAMRPGKPLMVGRLGGTPLLGLPGNPVSSMVCALLFLRPALGRMLGVVRPAEPQAAARLAAPLPANDRRQDYLRARYRRAADGELEVEPFPLQDSSMLSLLARADCLVVRPPFAPPAAAGERVPIIAIADGVPGV